MTLALRHLLRSACFAGGFVLCGSMIGCAATDDGDGRAVSGSEDEIRQLRADEYAGFLQYGDEIVVAYSSSPTYRAYRFRANAFDDVRIELTPETPNTKVWATLLDEQGNELIDSTHRGVAYELLKHTMSNRFGELTLVVREGDLQAANIRVKVDSNGIRVPASHFEGTAGNYAAPAPLNVGAHDVAMRCLSKSYYMNNPPTASEGTGILSLDLSGPKPKVLGSDGVLGAPARRPDFGLDHAPLTATSQLANAIALEGKTGSTGSYRHLLQLTNVGPAEVRVEYALESIGGNTGTRAETISCVGVLKN